MILERLPISYAITLLSDIPDWPVVIGGIIAALTPIGGGIGFLVKYLVDANKADRETQRAHEKSLVEDQRGMVDRMERMHDKFTEIVHQIRREQQQETRETVGTLLKIQAETVNAVSGLGQKVSELGNAITGQEKTMDSLGAAIVELRHEIEVRSVHQYLPAPKKGAS